MTRKEVLRKEFENIKLLAAPKPTMVGFCKELTDPVSDLSQASILLPKKEAPKPSEIESP